MTMNELFDVLDVRCDEEWSKKVYDTIFCYSNLLSKDESKFEFSDTKECWKELALALTSKLVLDADYEKEETYKGLAELASVYQKEKDFANLVEIIKKLSSILNYANLAFFSIALNIPYDRVEDYLKKTDKKECSNSSTSCSSKSKKQDFIYIAKQLNEKRLYKIGCTNDISKRLGTFKTGNCFVEIIASKMVDDKYYYEKWLHDYFKSKQYKNEWYKLEAEDIETLTKMFGFNLHIHN